MIRLLPALHSLTPPTVCMDMQLERFSPFHRHASLYGLDDVRATAAYAAIYPWPEKVLGEVAYTFDYRQDHSLLRRALIRRLHEEVKAWQDDEGRVELSLRRVGQGASVVETRLGAEDREVQLDDLDTVLYAACEDIGAFDDLVRLATLRPESRDRLPAEAEELVASRLQRLVDERIMVEVGGRYLSLARTTLKDQSLAV
jgi:hypothetical protein